MKILSLTAENVKRLSVVQIDTQGAPAIVLAGDNEAGKSSVLDAIEMALRGKRSMPPRPVHEPATSGKIVLDMGEYVVTRTITASGGSLTVKSADGSSFPSPQALLDRMLGDLSFDPMAFAEMPPAEQGKTLRAVAGIDTSEIDASIDRLFAERTDVSRDAKYQIGALESAEAYPDVTGPVDTAALEAALEAADAADAQHAGLDREVLQAESELQRQADKVSAAVAAVAAANADVEAALDALDAARKRVEATQQAYITAQAGEQAARDDGNTAYLRVKTAKAARQQAVGDAPDRATLRRQLAEAGETNRKAAANARHAQIKAHVEQQQQTVDRLTAEIEQARALKTAALAGATMPIPGLGLAEDGTVTWNGLPFEQASTAIRLRTSVAIGLALNPTIKVVLVRNGNDLGPTNLAAIAEMAAEADAQVWIERIAGADGIPTVLIEDGHVAGAAPPAAPEKKKRRNVRADVAAVLSKVGPVALTTAAELPAPPTVTSENTPPEPIPAPPAPAESPAPQPPVIDTGLDDL